MSTPFNPNRHCPHLSNWAFVVVSVAPSKSAPIFHLSAPLALCLPLCISLSITTKIFNFGSGPYKYIGFVFYCHIHSKYELIQNMKRNVAVTPREITFVDRNSHEHISMGSHAFTHFHFHFSGNWTICVWSHWSVVLVLILFVIQTRVSLRP